MNFTEGFWIQIILMLIGMAGIYASIRAELSSLKTDVKWIKEILQQSNYHKQI